MAIRGGVFRGRFILPAVGQPDLPVVLSLPFAGPVAATLNVTLDPFTLSVTSDLLIQASLNVTLDPFTTTTNADLLVQGSLSWTLDAFTLAANGDVDIKATLSATIAAFVSTATGQLLVQGNLTVNIGAVTTTEAAQLLIQGSLSVGIGPVTLSANGSLVLASGTGNLGVTLAAITLAASADLIIAGSLAQTIAPVTQSAAGTIGAPATIWVGLTAGVTNGVIGSGGSLPTGWDWDASLNVTLEVVGHGADDSVETFDLKISATTGAGPSYGQVSFPAGWDGLVAADGQQWRVASYQKVVATTGGGLDAASSKMAMYEAIGQYEEATPPATSGAYQLSYRELVHSLVDDDTTALAAFIQVGVNATGGASSVTVRLAANLEMVAGVVDADTWDPATLTGIGTLSHDNLMMTAAAGVSPTTIQSTTWHNSGLHYAETTFVGGNPTGHWGLYNVASDTGTMIDLDTGQVLQRPSGTLTALFPPKILDGDTIALAYEADTGEVWFRKNGGPWNDDRAQSPDSTGIGLWARPTDVGCSGTLTLYTGDYRLSVPDTVYENMDFPFFIDIRANNITLRNCNILSDDFFGVDADGQTGLVLDHCTVRSTVGRNSAVLTGNDFLIHHCDLAEFENGIAAGSNGVIENNLIHNLHGSAEAHIDAVQFAGNNVNVIIRDNWFESWDTSCIMVKADFGPIDNILIENNTLINEPGQYVASPLYSFSVGTYLTTNVVIRRNRVQRGTPAYGGLYILTDNSTPECFDNIDYDTSEPILLEFQGFAVTGQALTTQIGIIQVPPVNVFGVSASVSTNFVGLAGDVFVDTPSKRSHVYSTYGQVADAHVPKPAGVAENDLLIVAISRGRPGEPISPVVPFSPGWTQIGDYVASDFGGFIGQLSVWFKVAGPSEPSEYLFAFFEETRTQFYCAAYSGCRLTGGIDDISQNSGYSATAVGLSVNPTQDTDRLIYFGTTWAGSGTLSPPTGMTEIADGVLYVAEQALSGHGATGDRTQAQDPADAAPPWMTTMVTLRGA